MCTKRAINNITNLSSLNKNDGPTEFRLACFTFTMATRVCHSEKDFMMLIITLKHIYQVISSFYVHWVYLVHSLIL